jgi:hypothetical protein
MGEHTWVRQDAAISVERRALLQIVVADRDWILLTSIIGLGQKLDRCVRPGYTRPAWLVHRLTHGGCRRMRQTRGLLVPCVR